jgi:predicted Zn-dependent protease
MNNQPAMISVETTQMLVQVGLMASWARLDAQSETIFHGAIAAYPRFSSIRVSYAVSLIAANRLADAQEILEKLTREFPRDMMGRSALAMVLKEQGKSQWRDHAEQVINNGQDEEAIELAEAVLAQNTLAAGSPRSSMLGSAQYV